MATTLYKNGNTYEVELEKANEIIEGNQYITVDGKPYRVISEVQTNSETITEEMSEAVKPESKQRMETAAKQRERTTKNVNHAQHLVKWLQPYEDEYSKELRAVLKNFIEKPEGNLADNIDKIKAGLPKGGYLSLYNDFDINATLSEIFWPVE